jgi:hypothetical protein
MVQPDGMAVPPQEVMAIVHSAGLEPLGRPLRQGPVYVMRARDPSGGEELRVIVNAHMGRIVRIVPVMMPRYGVPIVRPPGRIAIGPDGPGPEFAMPPPAAGGSGLAAPPYDPSLPPLPRPRPKLAATDAAGKPAGASSASAASQAGTKDGGASETTGSITRPAAPAPAIEMAE